MRTTPLEAATTGKVIQYINGLGRAHARKVMQSGYQRGEPDIDAVVDGRAVKIEMKRLSNKPTPLQMARLRDWQDAGALAGWCYSVDEVRELLNHIEDRTWLNPQLTR